MLSYQKESEVITSLIIQDNELKKLFDAVPSVEIKLQNDYFLSLLGAIVSQQLSGKVADVIYRRVLSFFKDEVTPEKIIQADTEALRELGLSYRKVDYIKSLANKVNSKEVHLDDISLLSNQEIIDMLTKIKGIGPWTAEMFLIFSLGRKNVFSVLDLGLRNGLQKLYDQSLSFEEMMDISKKWEPHQTYVSLALWRYNAI